MARNIFVVKTEIFAGTPINAGTSKASIPRTNMIKSTLNIAGRIRGSVILLNVVKVLDPAANAASSRDVSMFRNAADINRNTSGKRCMDSVQIIPHME
jgi:hypothetical protein